MIATLPLLASNYLLPSLSLPLLSSRFFSAFITFATIHMKMIGACIRQAAPQVPSSTPAITVLRSQHPFGEFNQQRQGGKESSSEEAKQMQFWLCSSGRTEGGSPAANDRVIARFLINPSISPRHFLMCLCTSAN